MASGTSSAASEASTTTTATTTTTTTATTRLTRGALKKITDSSATDAGEQTLLQQYATFQHGLATPRSKRRRVSSSTSESTTENDDAAFGEQENQAPRTPKIGKSAMAVVDASAKTATRPSDGDGDNSKAASGSAAVEQEDRASAASTATAMPTVAEIALAQDEKKLEGAPEGELFVVTVLNSNEIEAASDVEAEIAAVKDVLAVKAATAVGDEAKDEAELSWAKEYAALDSLRRLAIHHRKQLSALLKETDGRVMTQLVCPAAMNLRSAMVRNALLCIQDLVVAAKQDSEQFYGEVVSVLLQRTANEKQFIRDLARDALTICVESNPSEKLLTELLRISITEKNAQIVNAAGLYTQKCIGRMDKTKLKAFVLATHENFMEEMSAFLNCKVVECKAAARRTLQFVRRHIGENEFTTLAKAKLEGTAQFEVLKASEEKKVLAKSGVPKLSMRERMLQMKKQQAVDQASSSAAATDDVVVLVPDARR